MLIIQIQSDRTFWFSFLHCEIIFQKFLEVLYGNLNLYDNLKKVNFCYLVTWTQPLQAEIQITK